MKDGRRSLIGHHVPFGDPPAVSVGAVYPMGVSALQDTELVAVRIGQNHPRDVPALTNADPVITQLFKTIDSTL